MLDTTPLCIIRELAEVHAIEEQVFNDTECPLLTLTNSLYNIIPTSHIVSSVSIMHECNPSCTFENAYTSIPRERETLHTSKLIYTHDYSNKLFCLNVYAMSSHWTSCLHTVYTLRRRYSAVGNSQNQPCSDSITAETQARIDAASGASRSCFRSRFEMYILPSSKKIVLAAPDSIHSAQLESMPNSVPIRFQIFGCVTLSRFKVQTSAGWRLRKIAQRTRMRCRRLQKCDSKGYRAGGV